MAYIRTCMQNLGEIRLPVRNNCPSSLIIDFTNFQLPVPSPDKGGGLASGAVRL